MNSTPLRRHLLNKNSYNSNKEPGHRTKIHEPGILSSHGQVLKKMGLALVLCTYYNHKSEKGILYVCNVTSPPVSS